MLTVLELSVYMMNPNCCSTSMSIEQCRVNAKSLEVEDEVRVFIAWGQRVEANIEIRIPEPHSLRAGITEYRQSCLTGVPVDGPQEVDA